MNSVQKVRATLLATARTGAVVNASPVMTDADDTLRHVVTCIDRTCLERRIQISLSNDTDLTLYVRNRRLLRFSVASRSSLPRSNGLDQRDDICAPKDCAEILRRLASLFKDRTIVRQRIVDDPTIMFPTTSGVSATSFLRCIDESRRPNTTIDLVAFLTKCIEDATVPVLGACVLTSEDILAISGSDEQLLAMVDWAKSVLELPRTTTFPMSIKLQSDGACLINWSLPTPRRLLISRALEQIVLILVEHDQNVGFLSELRDQLSVYQYVDRDREMCSSNEVTS